MKYPITLDNCSPLNRLLHSHFLDQLQQLSCTNVQVQDPSLIMTRLSQSDQLKQFLKICKPDNSSLLWRCFAFSEDESLSLIFAPCFLCSTPQSDAVCFPLVLMYTNLSSLMDSADNNLPSDIFINKLFSNEDHSLTPPTILSELSSKLENFHKISYLHSIYSILRQDGFLNVRDIAQGLKVCDVSEISVDITPLVVAICKHIKFCDNNLINTDSVSKLLEKLGDQRQSDQEFPICLSLDWTSNNCHKRREEIKNIFKSILSDLSLHSINNMDGYYWHSLKQELPTAAKEVS